MLNRTDLRDLIEATLLNIKLTGAVIEKDYYVTQVIHALSNIQNENFCLVFAGGTCLAKAHRIVDRMSEDVDFKIQLKGGLTPSRSRLIKDLKEFRSLIKSSLNVRDITLVDDVVRNEGKYQRISIEYPHLYPMNSTLRPHILLEFTLSNPRHDIENLPVKTIIENVLTETRLFNSPNTPCISVNETAIEKWVGLTRRIVAIERKYHHDDPTLVRHIYDLNAIMNTNQITDAFFALATDVVKQDAAQFKNQHPEYFNNPKAEIEQSLEILNKSALWKNRYQGFIDSMVYDTSTVPDYINAVKSLGSMSSKVIHSLSKQ